MIIIAGTVQSNGPTGFWLWSGGGIYNSNTGMTTITGSTISGNHTGNPGHSGADGGGIVNYGTMTIQDSTITGNTALGGDLNGGHGGGISGNNTTITNSTITGNSALRGGGFAGGGNIAHTTFSQNSAPDGGALYLSSPLEVGNTILKAGASGVNIFNNGGSLITHGYNISSDDGGGFLNGPGDQINTDPMLGPLQDNGGPTFTHALLPGSPAIDAGDPNFIPPPYYDQRGPDFLRVRNGHIDVGSFEVQAGSTPSPTPTATATPTTAPSATPTATTSPIPTATPSPAGCWVTSSSPPCDSIVVGAPPTDFTINLSAGEGGVRGSDFMVNGTPANSVTVLSGTQIIFHFDTSPVVEGLNTMHIPAGAFSCGEPGGQVQEFTCTFTYQPSTPTPTSTPRPSPTPRPAPSARSRPTPPPRP
jgi:predicted outer membrane repeat protein